jgi:isopentenyl phosphate kinase
MTMTMNGEEDDIVILKIGGSSITNKANEETLNDVALEWFAHLISSSIDPSFLSSSVDDDGCRRRSRVTDSNSFNDRVTTKTKKKKQFIVVHGAGSFGHHSAKRFGLRCGKAVFLEEIVDRPSTSTSSDSDQQCRTSAAAEEEDDDDASMNQRYRMEGLSKTRQSVQKLNAATVNYLIQHGVNAVGISPGMTLPGLRAHGATSIISTTGRTISASINNSSSHDDSYRAMQQLCDAIQQSLQAGLVPVVHGDACLLYDGKRAGILGGDTIAEGLATLWNNNNHHRTSKISQVIFITDVAGVFTSDPKMDPNATLIRLLTIHEGTGKVAIETKDGDANKTKSAHEQLEAGTLDASGSSHEHDVTGGLKVKWKIIAHMRFSSSARVMFTCLTSPLSFLFRQSSEQP